MTTLTTNSSGRPDCPPGEPVTDGLRQARVRLVVRALATHPILPPASEVPLPDETIRPLLADLARAQRSGHVGILRQVSEERGVPVDELARRAQFMLACLLLPASGTFYEILGVPPHASAKEIRQHWAAAIHRYHPDRFGGQNSWFDAQARRLIVAYETLRDPVRRSRYDAELGWARVLETPAPPRPGPVWRRQLPLAGRWPWIAAVGVVLLGLAAAVALLSVGPPPLTPAPLPPAPKLLEKWLAAPPAEQSLDKPSGGAPSTGPARGDGDPAP